VATEALAEQAEKLAESSIKHVSFTGFESRERFAV